MKATLFLTALLICSFSFGQKVVALHSGGTVTMFNSANPFIDAYTAASNGDTLYLPGGALTPPSTIDKRLVIIGAGFHADSTTATYPTFISTGFNLGENADQSILEGLHINGSISAATSNIAVSNVQIRRCLFTQGLYFPGDGSTPTENFLIQECVFEGSLNIQNFRNCLLTNSIFNAQISYSSSNLIQNCIFLREGGTFSSASARTIYYAYNNTLANNIIYNSSVYSVSGDGNVFENNLFCSPTPELGSAPIEINSYLGVSQASVFVAEPDFTWSESDDHHLQDPVTYIGNDANPVGIYGGFNPFKTGAVPHNPHISSKTIAPQTDASGQLNIQITTTAQDN
jgi:hypothetical protein